MRFWSPKELRSLALTISLTAVILPGIWLFVIWLHGLWSPPSPGWALSFSSPSLIHLQYRGHLTHSHWSGKSLYLPFHIQCILSTSHTTHPKGALYRCKLEELTLFEPNGEERFHFSRLPKYALRYRFGSHLSLSEREEICRKLHISFEDVSSLEDSSLLLESLSILMSDRAALLQLIFSPSLRSKIEELAATPSFSFLFRELLNPSLSLPPLLPQHASADPWSSQGELLGGSLWHHQARKAGDGSSFKILSRGSPTHPLSSALDLQWEWNSLSSNIPHIQGSFSIGSEHSLMGQQELRECVVEFSCQIAPLLDSPTLAEAP